MHFRRVAGAVGQTFLVNGDMAAIAVFVSYRVADLTGEVTQVLFMLRVALGIGPDVSVTVLALDQVRVLIPGSH